MKEQCSSATTMYWELCVMIHGMTMMQLLCVNSLDTQVSVTHNESVIYYLCGPAPIKLIVI